MKLIIVLILAASTARSVSAEPLTQGGDMGRDAQPASYDASWYKDRGWFGEYPNGFTMADSVTIKIRESLDLAAPKSVTCTLTKGATYHPWNEKRVISDGLEFFTLFKTETYELNQDFAAGLTRTSDDNSEITIKFKKGDRWLLLHGIAEGSMLIKFGDTTYIGDQGLFERSTKVGAPAKDTEEDSHEWLKLKCANGAVGWIFRNEITNDRGFSSYTSENYGSASDR